MPISDWNVPATLASVYGDLALNTATGDRYILMREGCDMWQDVRAQQLNVPQEDGSLIQERFLSGTRLRLQIGLWYNDEPACYEDLTRMVDTLSKHAGSMVKAAFSGRFLWDPEGAAVRLLDYMQMADRMTWNWAEIVPQVTLVFDSPFPYAIDFTQISSGAGTLNNTGNTTMYPVFQVTGGGPFTLSNNTTGLSIVFTGSYSGYAEIDTFRNTIYQNGDGANLKDGIDVENSDFWGLVPGNNSVSISGGSVTVLWQAAWI